MPLGSGSLVFRAGIRGVGTRRSATGKAQEREMERLCVCVVASLMLSLCALVLMYSGRTRMQDFYAPIDR